MAAARFRFVCRAALFPLHWRPKQTALAALAFLVSLNCPTAGAAALPLARIRLPPGFHIELVSAEVPTAREMVLSPGGVLYVGSLNGAVYALKLAQARVVGRYVVANGLDMPVGVAFHAGALYVSAVSKILRFDDIDRRLASPPEAAVVTDQLPTEHHHGWKFIAFGPAGKLYVPTGAPCNVCLKNRDRYAVIGRMNPDGSGYQTFARVYAIPSASTGSRQRMNYGSPITAVTSWATMYRTTS